MASKKTSRGMTWTLFNQVRTLIEKDLLLKRRTPCISCLECVCPVIILFLGCFVVYWIDLTPSVVPYASLEKVTLPVTGLANPIFSIDPFPLQCANIDAISLFSIQAGADPNGPPPGLDPDKLKQDIKSAIGIVSDSDSETIFHTKFDCFFETIVEIIPLWRAVSDKMARYPKWMPMPFSFAVVPGAYNEDPEPSRRMDIGFLFNHWPHDMTDSAEKRYYNENYNTSTVGGKFAVYLNERYDKRAGFYMDLYHSMDECFTAEIVEKNTIEDLYEIGFRLECVNDPIECLLRCLVDRVKGQTEIRNGESGVGDPTIANTTVPQEISFNPHLVQRIQDSYRRKLQRRGIVTDSDTTASPRTATGASSEIIASSSSDRSAHRLLRVQFNETEAMEHRVLEASKDFSSLDDSMSALRSAFPESIPAFHEDGFFVRRFGWLPLPFLQTLDFFFFSHQAAQDHPEQEHFLEEVGHKRQLQDTTTTQDVETQDVQQQSINFSDPFFGKMQMPSLESISNPIIGLGSGKNAKETPFFRCSPYSSGRIPPDRKGGEPKFSFKSSECKAVIQWARLGSILRRIRPNVLPFKSEEHMEVMVNDARYPKSWDVPSKKSGKRTSFSEYLCGAVVFDEQINKQVGQDSLVEKKLEQKHQSVAGKHSRELDEEDGTNQHYRKYRQLNENSDDKKGPLSFSIRLSNKRADRKPGNFGFDTGQSRVASLSNPMFALTYMISGFLGLQTVVNDFLLCNPYTDLSKVLSKEPEPKIDPDTGYLRPKKDPNDAFSDEEDEFIVGRMDIPEYNWKIRDGPQDGTSSCLYSMEHRQPKALQNHVEQMGQFRGVGHPKLPPHFNTDRLKLGSFGIPQHLDNLILQYLAPHLKDNLWFSFSIPILFAASHILGEKELRIRVGMKLQGLWDASYYLEVLLFNGLWSGFICLWLVLLLFSLPYLVHFSSITAFLPLFWLPLWSALSVSAALTTMFQSANLGKIIIFGLIYISSLIGLIVHANSDSQHFSDWQIWMIMLVFPSMQLKFSLRVFTDMELLLYGVNWNTLRIKTGLYRLSVWDLYSVSLSSIIFYTFLFMYLDQVFPGEWGQKRKWNFIFDKIFWKLEVLGIRDKKGQETSIPEEVLTLTGLWRNLTWDTSPDFVLGIITIVFMQIIDLLMIIFGIIEPFVKPFWLLFQRLCPGRRWVNRMVGLEIDEDEDLEMNDIIVRDNADNSPSQNSGSSNTLSPEENRNSHRSPNEMRLSPSGLHSPNDPRSTSGERGSPQLGSASPNHDRRCPFGSSLAFPSVVAAIENPLHLSRCGAMLQPQTRLERQLEHDQQCLRVRNLKKVFPSAATSGKNEVAVDGINLTIYRDQVFVLLGHNGAGKTTTFNMLSGLLEPTSGDCIYLNGRNMHEQLAFHRHKVGICPQHTVIWPNLTVMEHLTFFARFKGHSVDGGSDIWNPLNWVFSMVLSGICYIGRILWQACFNATKCCCKFTVKKCKPWRIIVTKLLRVKKRISEILLGNQQRMENVVDQRFLLQVEEDNSILRRWFGIGGVRREARETALTDGANASSGSIEEQAMHLLKEQCMADKACCLAGTLSGGSQRKLSLAIAFMGSPEVVFLDEPSSGMDSSARKEIWDLIRTRRKDRVTILTTHYMDEADVLGDKIAIMAHGKVRCCGSPDFLKRQYGCGYNITFNLKRIMDEDQIGNGNRNGRNGNGGTSSSSIGRCSDTRAEEANSKQNCRDIQNLLEGLFKPYPVSCLSEDQTNALLFLVPFAASEKFATAFGIIDAQKDRLNVSSWDLKVCDLEEVFLKVATEERLEIARADSRESTHSGGETTLSTAASGFSTAASIAPLEDINIASTIESRSRPQATAGNYTSFQVDQLQDDQQNGALLDENDDDEPTALRGASKANQLQNLLRKRCIVARRNWGVTVCQLLCPTLLSTFSLYVINLCIHLSFPSVDLMPENNYNLFKENPIDRIVVPYASQADDFQSRFDPKREHEANARRTQRISQRLPGSQGNPPESEFDYSFQNLFEKVLSRTWNGTKFKLHRDTPCPYADCSPGGLESLGFPSLPKNLQVNGKNVSSQISSLQIGGRGRKLTPRDPFKSFAGKKIQIPDLLKELDKSSKELGKDIPEFEKEIVKNSKDNHQAAHKEKQMEHEMEKGMQNGSMTRLPGALPNTLPSRFPSSFGNTLPGVGNTLGGTGPLTNSIGSTIPSLSDIEKMFGIGKASAVSMTEECTNVDVCLKEGRCDAAEFRKYAVETFQSRILGDPEFRAIIEDMLETPEAQEAFQAYQAYQAMDASSDDEMFPGGGAGTAGGFPGNGFPALPGVPFSSGSPLPWTALLPVAKMLDPSKQGRRFPMQRGRFSPQKGPFLRQGGHFPSQEGQLSERRSLATNDTEINTEIDHSQHGGLDGRSAGFSMPRGIPNGMPRLSGGLSTPSERMFKDIPGLVSNLTDSEGLMVFFTGFAPNLTRSFVYQIETAGKSWWTAADGVVSDDGNDHSAGTAATGDLDSYVDSSNSNSKSHDANGVSYYGGFVLGVRDQDVLIQTNGTGIHAAPIFLQMFYNVLWNMKNIDKENRSGLVGNSDLENSEFIRNPIIPKAHLLPLPGHIRSKILNAESFVISFNLMVAFGFVSAFGLVFVVFEKEAEIKTQQFINGVSIVSYWVANYIFDVLMYIVPVSTTILLLIFCDIGGLVGTDDSLRATLIVLSLFALASPGFGYISAHFFKSSSTALTLSVTVNIIFGSILTLVIAVFYALPFPNCRKFGHFLHYLGRLWPLYTLGDSLTIICGMHAYWDKHPLSEMHDTHWQWCVKAWQDYELAVPWVCARSVWDFDFGIGSNILFLGIEAFLYLVLTIFIDFCQEDFKVRQFLAKWLWREKQLKDILLADVDDVDDVFTENERENAMNNTKFDDLMMRYKRDAHVLDEERRVGDFVDYTGSGRHTDSGQRLSFQTNSIATPAPALVVRNVSKLFYTPRSGIAPDEIPSLHRLPSDGIVDRRSLSVDAAPSLGSRSLSSLGGSLKSCFYSCRRRYRMSDELYAVKDVSVSLQRGEVFGLLGENGAGKTTLFRMLCGIEVPCAHPSAEILFLNKHGQSNSVFRDRENCRKLIGYCSQANPLWPLLSVREHLYFYANVKGVRPISKIERVVKQQLEDLDLVEHEHKLSHSLSGGNKRKLVIAMSLIGSPPFIFLDEPSAGVDPDARRRLWSLIRNISRKQRKSTIVLTTHFMQECEALCSRIGIMATGVMRCLDSIPGIKETYGRGVDIYVKFDVSQIKDADEEEELRLLEDRTNTDSTSLMMLHPMMVGMNTHRQSTITFEEAESEIRGEHNILPLFTELRSRSSPFAMVAQHYSVLKEGEDLSEEQRILFSSATCTELEWRKWLVSTRKLVQLKTFLAGLFCVEENNLNAGSPKGSSSPQEGSTTANSNEQTGRLLLSGSHDQGRRSSSSSKSVIDEVRLLHVERHNIDSATLKIGAINDAARERIRQKMAQIHGGQIRGVEKTEEGQSVLGNVFGILEFMKHTFGIAEYAVTPTTLEHVFHSFARDA